MVRRVLALSILLSLPLLGGCGTIYKAAVDQRDTSTFVDDSRIESSVRARFLQDEVVLLRDVSVNAYLAHVYLVGEFDSESQKLRAVRLAREVDGVRRVTVVPFAKRDDPECGTASDLQILAKLKASLIGDKEIMSTQVDVKVVQCNVVLLGLVGSRHDADAVLAHANEATGVRTVQNLIRILK